MNQIGMTFIPSGGDDGVSCIQYTGPAERGRGGMVAEKGRWCLQWRYISLGDSILHWLRRQTRQVVGCLAPGVFLPHLLEQPLQVMGICLAIKQRTLRPTLPHFGSHSSQTEIKKILFMYVCVRWQVLCDLKTYNSGSVPNLMAIRS